MPEIGATIVEPAPNQNVLSPTRASRDNPRECFLSAPEALSTTSMTCHGDRMPRLVTYMALSRITARISVGPVLLGGVSSLFGSAP
jgi:hypothetical protein